MKCPRREQENPPQAKFCLECATRRHRGMGMRFWIEKAKAQVRGLV